MSERLDTNLRKLVDLREKRDEAKGIADAAERAYREHEAQLWEEIEDAHGKVTTLTVDLGEGYGKVQFQRRATTYSRIIDEDAFVDAVKREGREEEFLKPGIRKKVLNEEVRDRNDRGVAQIDGVDFTVNRYISIARR